MATDRVMVVLEIVPTVTDRVAKADRRETARMVIVPRDVKVIVRMATARKAIDRRDVKVTGPMVTARKAIDRPVATVVRKVIDRRETAHRGIDRRDVKVTARREIDRPVVRDDRRGTDRLAEKDVRRAKHRPVATRPRVRRR